MNGGQKSEIHDIYFAPFQVLFSPDAPILCLKFITGLKVYLFSDTFLASILKLPSFVCRSDTAVHWDKH